MLRQLIFAKLRIFEQLAFPYQTASGEVDPIIRTTGLDRNPCVFLSRKKLFFWDSTKEGVYAKEKAFV
jgi:hypothetical protein